MTGLGRCGEPEYKLRFDGVHERWRHHSLGMLGRRCLCERLSLCVSVHLTGASIVATHLFSYCKVSQIMTLSLSFQSCYSPSSLQPPRLCLFSVTLLTDLKELKPPVRSGCCSLLGKASGTQETRGKRMWRVRKQRQISVSSLVWVLFATFLGYLNEKKPMLKIRRQSHVMFPKLMLFSSANFSNSKSRFWWPSWFVLAFNPTHGFYLHQ